MIRHDFEIDESSQPRTKAEALALAQAWGHTLSHNDMCFNGGSDGMSFQPDVCATANAAEVQRLAALWTMLPDDLPGDATSDDLTSEEIQALLWVVRNVDYKALRAGPYRPQEGVFSHGALSTATNKIERVLGRRLA